MGVVREPDDDELASMRRHVTGYGRALAGVLLAWSEVNHRKVEAIALLAGDRARRRISVDLTPAHIPWPPVRESEDVGAQIVVPLTLVAKGPMRSLDMVDDGGRTLPVLGRSDNGLLATAALEAVLDAENGLAPVDEPDLDQWRQLYRIACGDIADATLAAEGLIEALALGTLSANFVRDLASNFLLCALLPSAAEGVRQIVKFSYQWDGPAVTGDRNPARRLERLAAGLGLGSFKVEVDLRSPSSTASYHLEVPAPDGLVCTSLEMPPGTAGLPRDDVVTPFGHVFDTYVQDPTMGARAQLEVSSHGLHPTVAGASVGTFFLFLLALVLPDALTTLRASGAGANGLLLFGPALLLAVIGGRRESSIVSQVLLPLRVVSLLLSAGLFAAGASLVGKLHEPWLTSVWIGLTALTGILAAVLAVATVRLRKRGGRHDDGG